MTNDARTSDDIEREIADDRAQISDTFDDLRQKFSVDAIMNDVGTMFREQGGELGRKVSDTMGRNPTAVVLVGVGLAWLLLGQDRKTSANHTESPSGRASGSRRAPPEPTPLDRDPLQMDRSNNGGLPDDCAWYGDGTVSCNRRFEGQASRDGAETSSGNDDAAKGKTGAARNAATAARDTVSDAAGKVGHATSNLTERLSQDLDDLTEEAKSRVVSARRAAHEARLSSGDALRRGSRQASNFFEDQPLVVGALAVAVGAAIGGMLPNSKVEDDAVGESSDRLYARAQEMLQEERDKAKAVLRTVATDVKEEIQGAKSDAKVAGDKVADRASESAERVVESAKGEAEKQGLGRRKS
ncbi:DUF3618 domain-containing protein [Roseovarius nitratireducens]|uniref:DUF3618 domain-containing protein n=1 Tax=Roseovarius nitratireducens TaxID=2044597 RepID=UPI0013ED7B53|nr:DUF3618 domain-containing protein [Roseovarius nitratireducens]